MFQNFFKYYFILFFGCLSSCSLFDTKKETQDDEVKKHFEGIHYAVTFDPGIPHPVLEIVEKASILKRLEKNPPLTLTALDKRALKDVAEITETLNIFGYFDAKVHFTLDKETPLPTITIFADSGTLYHIQDFAIEYVHTTPTDPLALETLTLSLSKGSPVNLEKARDIGKSIAKYYRGKGFPFARALTLKGQIDREKKTLKIIFVIDLKRRGTFGKTIIEGNGQVANAYIRNRFEWGEGKLFNEEKINETRKNLMESGLFNDVTIQAVEETPSDQVSLKDLSPTDIHVKLTEAPARSFGGGIRYATHDGWGGKVFWRHNNFLGQGDGLETRVEIGSRIREARIDYSTPDFLMRNQMLLTSLGGIEEITRAYVSKTGKGGGILSYDISRACQLRYGLEGEMGAIKRNGLSHPVRLFSIPLNIDFDGTRSILNPTAGIRTRVKSIPYFGHYQKNNGFWVNEVVVSTYFTPERKAIEVTDNVPVLAVWGKAGHINVRDLSYVPPTKRFYSGGGNSIRGYAYQLLGPLDADLTPIGGRSIVEFGAEYRFPIHEKFGLVAFIEGGSVGLNNTPKFNHQNLLFGTGIGIRYYTGMGPIRFDFAIPTKRRRDPSGQKIDDAYQFYISVGQAF